MSECDGCCHQGCCSWLSDDSIETDEVKIFEKYCIGCCCGEGCECNRDHGCNNYETEPYLG